MPEILTESFCERCGTRYTFESTAPRGVRLKGLRVVSRGLKNFVLSDDTSMDEAMAAARSESDREVTAQQLDAFHKTFNFCMSCRQYTCANCWNEAEGRCLSCAPGLGSAIVPAPHPTLDASGTLVGLVTNGRGTETTNGHDVAQPKPMSWPTSDLMGEDELPEPATAVAEGAGLADLLTRPGGLDVLDAPVAADPEPPVESIATQALAAGTFAAEPIAAEPHVVEPVATTPDAPGLDDLAAVAAAQTSDLLRRFRPGQSLDEEIAAFEREQAAAAAATAEVLAAEPVNTPEPEPAPAAAAPTPEPEPAPAAAAPTPEPEPAPAAAAPTPEPEPAPVAAAPEPEPAPEPRVDVIPQPVWQVVAPDSPIEEGGAPPSIAPEPTAPVGDRVAASAEPQWPAQPQWPAAGTSSSGLPFLGRPAAPTGGIEALWAESAREVVSAPVEATRVGGVQPCVSCGLSLSANARFCRRCGTRQG